MRPLFSWYDTTCATIRIPKVVESCWQHYSCSGREGLGGWFQQFLRPFARQSEAACQKGSMGSFA